MSNLRFIHTILFLLNLVLWLAVGSMAFQHISMDYGVGQNVFHMALTTLLVQAIFVVIGSLEKPVDVSPRESYNRFSDRNSGSH